MVVRITAASADRKRKTGVVDSIVAAQSQFWRSRTILHVPALRYEQLHVQPISDIGQRCAIFTRGDVCGRGCIVCRCRLVFTSACEEWIRIPVIASWSGTNFASTSKIQKRSSGNETWFGSESRMNVGVARTRSSGTGNRNLSRGVDVPSKGRAGGRRADWRKTQLPDGTGLMPQSRRQIAQHRIANDGISSALRASFRRFPFRPVIRNGSIGNAVRIASAMTGITRPCS